jgi:hypothetical protein
MDGGTADSHPKRRERKKWEREPPISLYVNEAELSKWTSRKTNDIPDLSSSSPPSTLSSQSTLPSTSTSSPSLQRSRSKPLIKATSASPSSPSSLPSPKLTRARPPSPSPSSTLSRPSQVYPPMPSAASPYVKSPARERFKSPQRQRIDANTNNSNNTPKIASTNNKASNNPIERSPPPIKAPSVSSSNAPTYSSPLVASPPSLSSASHSPPVPKVGDVSDKSRIVNFMCGVIKIFAHLISLPDGSEKQKEVKLAALEKRCKCAFYCFIFIIYYVI